MSTYQVDTDDGHTYEIDTDDSTAPEIGKGESFVRGAANNVPLAPQVLAGLHSSPEAFIPGTLVNGAPETLGENATNYSDTLKAWNEKAAAAKKANPASYGAGAVAGAIAPLAIPGVGEVMEAAPVVGNAALGAAGAISNTDITKDTGELAKQALEGAVVGGTVGKAGKVLGSAVNALKPAANRIEANATAGAIDLNSHAIRRLSPGNTNPESVMKEISDKIKDLFPNLVGYTDTAGSKLNKIITAHNQASEVIGQVIDATTEKTGGVLPEVNEAIYSLGKAAEKFNGRTSSENLEAANILRDKAMDLAELQKEGQLDFRNLYEVKKGIGETFHSPDVNKGNKIAYGIVSDTIDKILDRAHVDSPDLKEGFSHAKDVFKFTSDLIPAMKPGVAREAAGVGGGVGNAILGGAAITGHPVAIPAYAAKTAAKLVAPDLAQNIAYKTVNAAKNIPKVIPKNAGQATRQEIIDYLNSKMQEKSKGGVVKMSDGGEVPDKVNDPTPGLPMKYKQVLQQAQQRGPEALAAANFVLQQNDPEYNALVNAKHKE